MFFEIYRPVTCKNNQTSFLFHTVFYQTEHPLIMKNSYYLNYDCQYMLKLLDLWALSAIQKTGNMMSYRPESNWIVLLFK